MAPSGKGKSWSLWSEEKRSGVYAEDRGESSCTQAAIPSNLALHRLSLRRLERLTVFRVGNISLSI
jgi:hypothetical protein